jgi:hypothetical protein
MAVAIMNCTAYEYPTILPANDPKAAVENIDGPPVNGKAHVISAFTKTRAQYR